MVGTCRIVYVAVLVEQKVKNQKKRDKREVVGPCQRTKKAVEYEGDGDTSYRWRIGTVDKALERGLEELEIKEWIKII